MSAVITIRSSWISCFRCSEARKGKIAQWRYAFFTKHAFRPTAMPSTLQEISWSPSSRRMGLDLVLPLRTWEPLSFRSLIRMTQSPSARMLPWASLTTRGAVGGFGLGCLVPFVSAGGAFVARRVVQNIGHLAHRAGGLAHGSGIVGIEAGGNGAYGPAKNKQFAARLSRFTLRCTGGQNAKTQLSIRKKAQRNGQKGKEGGEAPGASRRRGCRCERECRGRCRACRSV